MRTWQHNSSIICFVFGYRVIMSIDLVSTPHIRLWLDHLLLLSKDLLRQNKSMKAITHPYTV